MRVEPYLIFDGRCEEALSFYRQALGAEIGMLLRFKDNPDPLPPDALPPNAADKIMHAVFKVGKSTVMASDGRCVGPPRFEGFSMALNVKDEGEAKLRFTALSDGGQVQMPLAKTFFSPCFGMVMDRFGVSWMTTVYL